LIITEVLKQHVFNVLIIFYCTRAKALVGFRAKRRVGWLVNDSRRSLAWDGRRFDLAFLLLNNPWGTWTKNQLKQEEAHGEVIYL
jgi:hypothetical protein